MPKLGLLLCVLLSAGASSLAAQVGATTDIITGIVVGPHGHPIAGVTVEAMSIETETTWCKTTSDRDNTHCSSLDTGRAGWT